MELERMLMLESSILVVDLETTKVTLDLGSSTVFDLTLSDNVDTFELSNIPTDGGTFTIKLSQDSVGGRTALIDEFRTTSNQQ